ncbi:MAG TPA: hypothetical protein VF221_19495 [Chloroflexota bacterium]
MAVDTMLLDVTRVSPTAAPGPAEKELTAMVIFDGEAWIAFCQDNGIVAQGATPEEAATDLVDAVTEAARYAQENGLQVGRQVPNEEVRQFLLSHHEGRGSVIVLKFQVR